LGTSKTWPQLTYVLESSPPANHLTHTPQVIKSAKVGYGPNYYQLSPFKDADGNLIGDDVYELVIRVTDMTPGGSFIDLASFHVPTQLLPESQADGEVLLEWFDNSDAPTNQFYTSDASSVVGVVGPGDFYTRFTLKSGETIPVTADLVAPGVGEIRLFVDGLDGGWNGAHLMASLLFDDWPVGIAQDTAKWDLTSLDSLATTLATEDLRCSIVAKDGKGLREVLGALMQDLGVTISLNPRTALLEAVPWRLPTGTLANIPNDAFTKRPRKRITLGARRKDRLVFIFQDEFAAFRDMPISVDDDGQASRLEFYNQDETPIASTANFETAGLIAQRRSAEELAKAHVFTIHANRAARALRPGEAITAEGFDEVLRVTSVQVDPLSGDVKLGLMNDFYGATLSDFAQPQGKGVGGGGEIGPDGIRSVFVEVPEVLTGPGGPQTCMLFAIRETASIQGYDLYISRDDATYFNVGFENAVRMRARRSP
jgi:hypothetical protein